MDKPLRRLTREQFAAFERQHDLCGPGAPVFCIEQGIDPYHFADDDPHLFASMPLDSGQIRKAVARFGDVPLIVDPAVPPGEVWAGTMKDGKFVRQVRVLLDG